MGMCTVVSLCIARYSCLCDLEIQPTLLAKVCPLMWGWVCPEENAYIYIYMMCHFYLEAGTLKAAPSHRAPPVG